MTLGRERRRLARAFKAALFAAGSPAILIACSSSSSPGGRAATGNDSGSPGADAALDSSSPRRPDTGAPDVDAGVVPDAARADVAAPKPPVDGGSGGCFAGSYELDSGADADASADTCAYVYACGLAGTGLGTAGCQVLQLGADGGLVPFAQMTCWLVQDAGCDDDAVAPDEAGGVTIYCAPCVGGGRRPAGLCTPRAPGGQSVLGAYLARMAFEESASVVAFERMVAELRSIGAPARLATAAARAAKDEARHARTMGELAAAKGGGVTRPRVRPFRPRRAAAVAAENAAEGCVRETFGALVARWQSLHAADEELRRAFSRIAVEEASHAALSWAVARWIEPRIGPAARRRVARSRSRALRALEASVAVEPPADLVLRAGVPSAQTARALLDAMARALRLATGCASIAG